MIPNGVSSSAVRVEIQLLVAPESNRHLTVTLHSLMLAIVRFSLFAYVHRLLPWGAEATLLSFPNKNGMAALIQRLGIGQLVGPVVVGCRVAVAVGFAGRENLRVVTVFLQPDLGLALSRAFAPLRSQTHGSLLFLGLDHDLLSPVSNFPIFLQLFHLQRPYVLNGIPACCGLGIHSNHIHQGFGHWHCRLLVHCPCRGRHHGLCPWIDIRTH